ncbi:DNA ligase D [Pseudomonas sp. KNUC1026]|uniref:DNA ligase D n=1 Tax=Pseudomonas sp. KNUC1026 TaxID=2893890 RepID=UPI001F2C5A42|nr:DNA ligase D [Pseudomonas sp. KNUC1026]UFH50986.1 DNA ligase D [Pseudomonas sp. KNUC1026]
MKSPPPDTPLDEYHRKRDFKATPEPAGSGGSGASDSSARQFVIQKHDASHLHYDFRLELDGTLKSWAVPKGPCLDPSVKRLAVQVEDHPIGYASFEGSIPQGHYGAGDVIVWDKGIWEPVGDPAEGYAKGRLKFALHGEKLAGQWNLVRTASKGKQQQWFLIKHRDEAARGFPAFDVLEAQPASVLSDRTLAMPGSKPKKPKAKRSTAMPRQLKPQLATLVEAAPSGEWCYELKFDGYRMLARVEAGEVRLFTRNGHDWTAKLPAQAQALTQLGLNNAWLDGEMVVLDESGVPSFQRLQNAFDSDQPGAILYYLFDLPWLNGQDLRPAPLEQRRQALAAVLEQYEGAVLRYSQDFDEDGSALLHSACELNMEGLIGKRAGSPYESRRSDNWIKLKCQQRQEFVVVGYTEPKGSRTGFGALLLGLHEEGGGQLRYAGRVGTGFSAPTLRSVHARLKPLQRASPALTEPPTGLATQGVHWLEPQLLAEVAYAQMTGDGLVRHAVFQGLRDDKPATGITQERAAPSPAARQSRSAGQVRITHPGRVIDPASGATKQQLADYYLQAADWLLPQLQQRPVALVRAPEGIEGELFFQKNAGHLRIPGVEGLDQAFAGQPVMLVQTPEALLGAVQMNTLELHTWNAVSATPEHPDRFILDLDPDPALPWRYMVEATQLTLAVLDELGLAAFIKTSGGKGMHIVVPLKPKAGWDEVKAFSKAIAEHIAQQIPERFSAVAGPRNRVGKIFIDYLRNNHGATTVAAYSARARPNLPVSVPVTRQELEGLKAADTWHIGNLPTRLAQLKQDPWRGFEQARQTISAAMKRRLSKEHRNA